MAIENVGEEYVLSGGAVVAGDDLTFVANGYVAVRSGRVVDVGKGPGPAEMPHIDVSGCVVMPGMINAHTHIEDGVLKELAFGVPADVNVLNIPDGIRHSRMAAAARGDLLDGMRAAAERMLASGTVAVADYRSGGAAGILLLREAFEGSPVRCLAFASHSRYPLQTDPVLAENRQELTPEQLADMEDALSLADGFAPVHVNHTTDPALRQIARFVRDRGKLLSTHSSASVAYRATSMARTGKSDVTRAIAELAPDFLVHMTMADTEELKEVVAAGIPMVMCPRSMAYLGRGIPPYASASELGAQVALGTDNAMMSTPDLFEEMAFLSRTTRALTRDPSSVNAREILAAATINAARALKLDNELGSIEKGKSASVVIVDFESANLRFSVDPLASLVDRATSGDIRGVLIDGDLAYGRLASPSRP